MADIFNVSPPAWLQQMTASNDKGLLGGILGELAGGALIAADKSSDPNSKENWFQALPQSVAEAHLNFLDPTWKIKVQQGQLNAAHTGLQLQEMQQQIGMNATKIKLTAQDTAEIPKWLQDHPTVESRMNAEWPSARTTEWNKNLDLLRLRDSQSVQSKVVVSGVKSFSDRIATLAKDDTAAAAQIAGAAGQYTQRGQMPPPELLQALSTAESAAQLRKENERNAATTAAEASRALGQSTLETRITDKGVQTIYKPVDAAKNVAETRKARIGTEMTTASGIKAVWVGENQIRLIQKSGAQADLTPGQLLSYAANFQYSADPAQKATAAQIQAFLGEKAKAQIGGTPGAPITTNAPAAKPAPLATKTVGVIGSGTTTDPAKPTTQEQFDSIPSKMYYINPKDGKMYQKK